MVTTLLTAMNLGERTAYAGRMTLIGMATVFAALAILWGALELFRIALQRKSGEKVTKEAPKAAPVAPAPAAPVVAAPTTNDSEIVAAITAAVSLMLAEENGGVVPGFRVVSFRRTRGK